MLHISKQIRILIRKALKEDIGQGDVTTDLLVPSHLIGNASIELKSKGVLCGGPVAREVFLAVDPRLQVIQRIRDGNFISKPTGIMKIRGRINSILRAERLALNFLGHLSGITTLTRQFVSKIKGTHAKIFDTRKTTPLWRELEKYAVRIGGGMNHRFGLWDELLVKDNHWKAMKMSFPRKRESRGRWIPACAGMTDCFAALAMTAKKIPVEVEVENLGQLKHLLTSRVRINRILLDNFSISELKKAIPFILRFNSKIEIEASGGVTLANVRNIAKTGVDRISIGALTHSARALDFSLSIKSIKRSRS
jgi:nicotinate-nucleotide pyrophosphorylase (carboxylating)